MTGPPNPSSTTDKSQYLSQSDIEFAVLKVRQSAIVQIERLQCFVEGAILAVEQVQDKRLQLVNEALEASASDIFLTAVMTLCLESQIAGKITVALTRAIVQPIYRTSTAFQNLPTERNRSAVAAFVRSLQGPAKESFAQVQELKVVGGGDINRLRRYAAALARGSSETTQDVVAVAKAAWASADKGTSQSEPPLVWDKTDTAGVGILDGAYEFASNQRVMIALHHAAFESLIRLNLMNKNELQTVLEEVQWESIEEDLKQVRTRYKLMFEAAIWAKLYHPDPRELPPNVESIKGVEGKLLNYWCQRFAKQIEEWSQGRPGAAAMSGQMMAMDPIRKGGFLGLPFEKQVSYMVNYLASIQKIIGNSQAMFNSK